MIVRIEAVAPSSHAERQPLGLALPLADATKEAAGLGPPSSPARSR
jgi:hypothetical protein